MLKWNWKLFLVEAVPLLTPTLGSRLPPQQDVDWFTCSQQLEMSRTPWNSLHRGCMLSLACQLPPLHITYPIFSWSCRAVAHAATNTVGAPAIGKTSYCFMSPSQRQKNPSCSHWRENQYPIRGRWTTRGTSFPRRRKSPGECGGTVLPQGASCS